MNHFLCAPSSLKTTLANCKFLQSCVDGPHRTTKATETATAAATKMSNNTNPNYGHSSGHSNLLTNFISAMNHSTSSMMTSSGDGASMGLASRQKPLMEAYLYKLPKKSKKYFVIFDDASDQPGTARLEYFENEKKFRSMVSKSTDNGITNRKRSIILRKCFNINRIDTKNKFVIGLYRKDDTFSIQMNSEEEMNRWLKQLLILQRGKELLDGDQPRPKFGE